jgi:hypothetical protein
VNGLETRFSTTRRIVGHGFEPQKDLRPVPSSKPAAM